MATNNLGNILTNHLKEPIDHSLPDFDNSSDYGEYVRHYGIPSKGLRITTHQSHRLDDDRVYVVGEMVYPDPKDGSVLITDKLFHFSCWHKEDVGAYIDRVVDYARFGLLDADPDIAFVISYDNAHRLNIMNDRNVADDLISHYNINYDNTFFISGRALMFKDHLTDEQVLVNYSVKVELNSHGQFIYTPTFVAERQDGVIDNITINMQPITSFIPEFSFITYFEIHQDVIKSSLGVK